MFKYFVQSFKRKIARRISKKYPISVDNFEIGGVGRVRFANWDNPLVAKKSIRTENIAFFKKFLSEGDLALDIGANIGLMSVQMSFATGKKGLTIGFDPNPYVFEILSQNAQLNSDKTRISVYNVAISDREEDLFYHSSEASFANGGVSKDEQDFKHGRFALKTKIKGVNLEQFLLQNHPDFMDKLKLVKIDTEGYDKEIIRTNTNLLLKYKPVVITECFGSNTPEEKFEQFDLLHSMGYSLFYFSDFSDTADIVPITKREDMLNWKHFDLYAIKD